MFRFLFSSLCVEETFFLLFHRFRIIFAPKKKRRKKIGLNGKLNWFPCSAMKCVKDKKEEVWLHAYTSILILRQFFHLLLLSCSCCQYLCRRPVSVAHNDCAIWRCFVYQPFLFILIKNLLSKWKTIFDEHAHDLLRIYTCQHDNAYHRNITWIIPNNGQIN